MGCSDGSDTDIWAAFDDAVERGSKYLEQARENYSIIQEVGEPLPEMYGTALAELEESIEDFDTVYDVTDGELERATTVADRAEFLAAVTGAYRTFYESLVDRRVLVVGEWFDELTSAVDEADANVNTDVSTLNQQLVAIRKLTDAEKYGQLQTSERVDLTEAEEQVREFDAAAHEALLPAQYARAGLAIADVFKDRYTDDLSELVATGVERDAISINEQVNEVPELDSVSARLADDETLSREDVDDVQTAVEMHAEIVRTTGERRAAYELGETLVTAIEAAEVRDPDSEDEQVAELQSKLTALDLDPIKEHVASLVEGEVTTSETEQIRRLLGEHKGSVRQTIRTVERPTDEVFDLLQELFVQKEIKDLEVRFE